MKKFLKLSIVFLTLGLSFAATPVFASSLGLPSGPVSGGR